MVDRNPLIDQLQTYPAEAMYQKRASLRQRGLEVFDFSVGDPIEPTDPAIRRAFAEGMAEVSQYPSIAGTASFRQACAGWVARRFGVDLDPEQQILPASGSKEAIFHLPLVFVDPRRRPLVIYGTPAYPVYERGARFAGATPRPVELRPEDDYRLEPWRLPAAEIEQTAMIWINYPHNPTAACVDANYLAELLRFTKAHDILLCSDECYADLYFGEPPPSILQVDPGEGSGALAFHSLSKRSGMTGYRSGFIAGDPALMTTLKKVRANFGVAQNAAAQAAAAAAWSDDGHAARRRETFRRKRDLFLSFFAEVGIETPRCEATLYLWVKVPTGQSSSAYAGALAERGVLVSPAQNMGVDQPYIRLALVPSADDCRRAIAAWKAEIEEIDT